ncbi:serine/threonine-protein phosphatase [Amycolatopsis rhizosphaerae]|uniref:Serine/threonine-protein phosphatase n=1 Tax=Amycolatopsis rhizosphaerae TaxID=2053003 RepID=A0A558DJL7_9PSEU|nr:PP2C family serine/threonine-protein phosphatase [Amycolatopsis rhizosphaerae]TVT61215.1 serine/threonine-protein phosphatase [Amycolatopsis rhizosphaerae]
MTSAAISYASGSRAGRLHGENQDRTAADPDHGSFLVADGMGGLADAAATARLIAEVFPRRLAESVAALADPGCAGIKGIEGITDTVAAAVTELNEQVRATARRGPGTTGAAMASLLVRDRLALAVHLGDSRIYLSRGGRLHRLTEDHREHGQLTRFVGMPGPVEPGVSVHELLDGDRLLLCTDGLTGVVDDAGLAALLAGAGELPGLCRRLLAAGDAALDDVSVLVVDIGGRQPR